MLILLSQAAAVVSLALLAYAYAGYPVALWLLTRLRRKRPVPEQDESALPTVTVLTAAYNEEAVIEEKLNNCLAIDYPPEKLQFVFISDGSTDGTNPILERYRSERIQVLIGTQRGGKIRALKRAFPSCRNSILVLGDANTYYRPDAIRKLVRHFQAPEVGAVSGDVRLLPSHELFGQGEGAYMKYERALQIMESGFGCMIGVDGAMYALRRELLVEPSDNIILDDFVISMNVAAQGFRIVYDPEALAEEDPTPTTEQEFARKVRVVSGGFQALLQGEGAPRWRQLGVLWMYLSHKLLRWFGGLLLAVLLAASLAAAGQGPLWAALLAGQGLFYLAALLGWKLRLQGFVFRIPFYFVMVNLASLAGLWRALQRRENVIWRKADRVPVSRRTHHP